MYPETKEQRKAGMAAFRAQILKAQQSALKNARLSKVARLHLEEDIALVKAIQEEKDK